MRRCCYRSALVMVLVAAAAGVRAQDLRQVEEPRVPPACVVLQARVAATDGVLPAEAEAVFGYRAHPAGARPVPRGPSG